MQTRKKPLIAMLSLIATLAVLFGGWFLYQKMEVEEPIRQLIGEMKSAQLAQLQVDRDQVSIKLQVTNPDAFPEEYKHLFKSVGEIVQNKQVDISIHNKDSQVKQVWADGVFAITEAVDLHQYSKIPALLEAWKRQYHLENAITRMDDTNVYVYLKRGTDDFYAVVPRFASPGEVTTNG
jgi:rhamnogalacturonyl hydrolase YesR